jgi:hypothetical protein
MDRDQELYTDLLTKLEDLAGQLLCHQLKSAPELWKFQIELAKYQINIRDKVSEERVSLQEVKDRLAETVTRREGAWQDQVQEFNLQLRQVEKRIKTYLHALTLSKLLGDALVWILLRFEQVKIAPLSANQPNPPIPDDLSLKGMLGVAEKMASVGAGFPLINDITNCLRIGDITFIHPDGEALPVEVKTQVANIDEGQGIANLNVTWYYVGDSERYKSALDNLRKGKMSGTAPDGLTEQRPVVESAKKPLKKPQGRLTRQLKRMSRAGTLQNVKFGEAIEEPGRIPLIPIRFQVTDKSFHWDVVEELARSAKATGYAGRIVDEAFLYTAMYLDKGKLEKESPEVVLPSGEAFAADVKSLTALTPDEQSNICFKGTFDYYTGDIPLGVRPFFAYLLPADLIMDMMWGRLIIVVFININKIVKALETIGVSARPPKNERELSSVFIPISAEVDVPGGKRLYLQGGDLNKIAAGVVFEFLSLEEFVKSVAQMIDVSVEFATGKAKAAGVLDE